MRHWALDVLDYVDHATNPEDSEWPSWVPEWFEPKSSVTMMGVNAAGFFDNGRSYSPQEHDNPVRGSPQRPRVLVVDGYMVDTVIKTADIISFEPSNIMLAIAALERIWSQIFECPFVPRQGRVYRDGKLLDIAFCKAISAHPLGIIFPLEVNGFRSKLNVSTSQDVEAKRQEIVRNSDLAFNTFMDEISSIQQIHDPVLKLSREAADICMGIEIFTGNRIVFLTRDGRLGLGPQVMQPGDEVAVFFSHRTPSVLRSRSDHHIFIGQCSLVDDEIMEGKVTHRIVRSEEVTSESLPSISSFELC